MGGPYTVARCERTSDHPGHTWDDGESETRLCPGGQVVTATDSVPSAGPPAIPYSEWCGQVEPHDRHHWSVHADDDRECPGVTAEQAAEGAAEQRIIDLIAWWADLAQAESSRVVPKAVEYGADDLAEIGRELVLAGIPLPARPQHNPWDSACSKHLHGEPSAIGIVCAVCRGTVTKDEEIYAELGIWFYLVGKMARWRSAVRRGERVSDDTLHDIGVYARMAQRVRETGRWP